MRRRVLVLAAHCDDAELGAGGLLAEAPEAHVWTACGRDPVRREEATAAAAYLGAGVRFGDYEDGRVEREPDSHKMIEELEEAILAIGPTLVAIPPADDTHADHRAVRAAALSALRRSPVSIVEYRSPSAPAGWAPSYWVPLSPETVDRVEYALTFYESQAAAAYLDGGLYRARVRSEGPTVGALYAEPHRVVRMVAEARPAR